MSTMVVAGFKASETLDLKRLKMGMYEELRTSKSATFVVCFELAALMACMAKKEMIYKEVLNIFC
jgi:hypothetical protein